MKRKVFRNLIQTQVFSVVVVQKGKDFSSWIMRLFIEAGFSNIGQQGEEKLLEFQLRDGVI